MSRKQDGEYIALNRRWCWRDAMAAYEATPAFVVTEPHEGAGRPNTGVMMFWQALSIRLDRPMWSVYAAFRRRGIKAKVATNV